MKLNIKLQVLFVFVIVIKSTFCARILGVIPTPSYSHQVVFYPLWRELSLRGHQVTLITTNPIKDPSLKNLTEIDVGFVYQKLRKTDDKNEKAKLSILEIINLLTKSGHNLIDKELGHPEISTILKNEKEHFDVLLVETLFPGMVLFAERFQCPLIQISSVQGHSTNYYMIGHPVHPILNPDLLLPFSGKLNFIERLSSTLYLGFSLLYTKLIFYPSQQAAAEKHFGNNYPDIETILSNTSLMFVNTDTVFHTVRALLPNVIQIGGGIHLSAPKPLPKGLQKVLDDATGGFIYFSLGTNIKSSGLPEDTRKILLETFSELPYTVLWKFEEEDLSEKPNNVIISKWFPQQDIFRHPNIKLFMSQGGLQSIDEAAHNHIPIIGMPFVGDQEMNVKRIVNKGIGLGLSVNRLDKSILRETILEVINNPKYRNRVRELAELTKDQPMTGLERAVWWTEYVIRHKGAKHLRSPALDIPAYQYYLLDIISFCFAIILIIGYVLLKLVNLISRFTKYFLVKSKVKME